MDAHMNKWSRKHDKCVECGLIEYPHFSKGRCKKCYQRLKVREKVLDKNSYLSKYGVLGQDYILCQICQHPFKMLNDTGHLKVHNISAAEYQSRFPGFPLTCGNVMKEDVVEVDIADVISKDQKQIAMWLGNNNEVDISKGNKIAVNQIEKLKSKINSEETQNKMDAQVEEIFQEYRKHGFPHYRFSGDQMLAKWKTIYDYIPKADNYRWDGVGSGLASSFHPHMMECYRKGKMSPLEFFNSDKDFKRGIRKVLARYPKVNISRIREICRTENKAGTVNNFPPRVAKMIKHHLFGDEHISVLDPCAGFSGRMLGFSASGISKYVGIDLSPDTVSGLNKTAEFIRKQIDMDLSVIHGDCLEELDRVSDCFDLVFTSPPFLDVEKYKGVTPSSDYSEWLSNFVEPFISKSVEHVRDGGYFGLYVEDIRRKYNLVDDCKKIAEKCGIVFHETIPFATQRREYLRKTREDRNIDILIWKKEYSIRN